VRSSMLFSPAGVEARLYQGPCTWRMAFLTPVISADLAPLEAFHRQPCLLQQHPPVAGKWQTRQDDFMTKRRDHAIAKIRDLPMRARTKQQSFC